MRVRGSLFVLALGVAGLSACVGRPAERPRAPMLQPPVELHVLLPLSGALAEAGEVQWDVVALAARRLNESRGPLERPLQPTIHDSGSTAQEALAKAEALVANGVGAFVAPAFPDPTLGLQDLMDTSSVLVVVPDARHLHADVGGRSTVALLPPDALRGAVLIDGALARTPDATTVASRRPDGAPPSEASAAAMKRAMARGLLPALASEADLVVIQAAADPPRDVAVRVRDRVLTTTGVRRVWTDPKLPEATLWMDHERATAATYDAVIALGRALRAAPDAPPERLREAVVGAPFEGMYGPTEFSRFGPAEAHYAHVPEVP